MASGLGSTNARVADAAVYVLLIVVCVLFTVPLLWILSTSFKTPGEIFTTPTTILPQLPTTENYRAIATGGFPYYLLNSLIAATGATLLGLVFCVPAAYGFAKFRFRSSGALLSFAVLTRFFPPIALALPFFLQFRLIGLIDTPFGLAIAYVPIVFPLMIWILEGFFRDYPDEILDAAKIDGVGTIGTLLRIVVPTSLPALGVATLFGFLVAWNEFIIALDPDAHAGRPDAAGRHRLADHAVPDAVGTDDGGRRDLPAARPRGHSDHAARYRRRADVGGDTRIAFTPTRNSASVIARPNPGWCNRKGGAFSHAKAAPRYLRVCCTKSPVWRMPAASQAGSQLSLVFRQRRAG